MRGGGRVYAKISRGVDFKITADLITVQIQMQSAYAGVVERIQTYGLGQSLGKIIVEMQSGMIDFIGTC